LIRAAQESNVRAAAGLTMIFAGLVMAIAGGFRLGATARSK
jgi:hypothetical protein